jgi:hypothetical protein
MRTRIIRYLIIFSLLNCMSLLAISNAGELVYSTFLGGGGDEGRGIAVDSAGNAYITGYTISSPSFPTIPGAYDTSYNGDTDVFVSKLNSSGSALLYSTFLGGSAGDEGWCIAVDKAGNAYITGLTGSNNFPKTTGAFDTAYSGGVDAFVSKLNPTGSALVYSTFIGGNDFDQGWCLAVDTAGNAYVSGATRSRINFPTTSNAYDTSFNGTILDAFVTKLNSTGSQLLYSTFLGGLFVDYGCGITVDNIGNAYVTGVTNSINFPTTSSAYDKTFNGGFLVGDAFVSKLNTLAAGIPSLVYSTFLGGEGDDAGIAIVVDSTGNAYITGETGSLNFPISVNAAQQSHHGDADAFVTKLNATGSTLLYSTYLGGSDYDNSYGIALDTSGNAYIAGRTDSSDFPITAGAFDPTYNHHAECVVSVLNSSGTDFLYSTFIGGNDHDWGTRIALDTTGSVYVTGGTYSKDFPTTAGAYDTTFNGSTTDVFVTKLRIPPSITGAVSYSDINNNRVVDQGDTLTLPFDRRMRVNNTNVSNFYLPVSNDKFGTGATVSINTANDTQVIITLGTSPVLTIPGKFSMSIITAGAPSGTDIAATMPANAIEDLEGMDAVDGGAPAINDSGVDILYTLSSATTYVPAYSAATVRVSTDTVNAYYTKHNLIIPAKSLNNGTTITAGPPGNNKFQLSAVSITPPTLTFSTLTPATLVLEYKDKDIRRELGYLETGMRIFQWKDSTTGWVLLPETYGKQSVDMNNKTVSLKINKANMVGATGNLLDDFAANTTIVYASISLPSVGAKTAIVAAASTGLAHQSYAEALLPTPNQEFIFAAGTTITLTVSTPAIYTKHKLTLTNYTTAYSGVTVALMQANPAEKHGHENNGVIKIEVSSTITTAAILTLEYKDYNDRDNQISNDVIEGSEYQMRIFKWQDNPWGWIKVNGNQTVNTDDNLVTVALDSLAAGCQLYAVGVDTSLALLSYSEFTDSSDIAHWYFDKYGDGSAGGGTLSWLDSYGSQSGVIKLMQTPGQKAQLTQVFSVPSTGWYSATVKVATDIADASKQQKVYLYLQELGSDTAVVATANQVLAGGSGAFEGAGEWRELAISFYIHGTLAGVQVVGINPSSSGVTGSLYIDDIWVTAGAAQPTASMPINNANFSSSTSGWTFQVYGDATTGGTWSWVSSLGGYSGVLKGTQAGREKGQISQLFAFPNNEHNALGSVWVYSGASTATNTQKIYLYIYSQDAGYTKIIESGNAILQPGKWTPGVWTQLQFGYIPFTPYNAVQLVGINPSGKPTQSIYFDAVEVKQD